MAINNHHLLITCLHENQYISSSYQLYNGSCEFQDYGILGSQLKNNFIKMWKDFFIANDDIDEIETPLITPHAVLNPYFRLRRKGVATRKMRSIFSG